MSSSLTLIPKNEVKDDWSKVPLEQLDNDLCIGHIDAEAFRYYIPALMLSVLDVYLPTTARVEVPLSLPWIRTRSTLRSWYTMLNEAQCRAIAHFLQTLPTLLPLRRYDAEKVARALRNYWERYLK